MPVPSDDELARNLARGLCPRPRQVRLTTGRLPLPPVLTWAGPDEVGDALTILTERLAPALDVVRTTQQPPRRALEDEDLEGTADQPRTGAEEPFSPTDTPPTSPGVTTPTPSDTGVVTDSADIPPGSVSPADPTLIVDLDPTLATEAYHIDIDSQIHLTAGSSQGARWAVQTLLQLLTPWVYGPGPLALEQLWLPQGIVDDEPRHPWRGAHLDVCRHFLPASFIMDFLDVLAMHKLNRLHLHLTDDQGWRLPVPEWPRLTTVGAWRPGTVRGHQPPPDENDCDDVAVHDNVPHGGAYTADELRAIDERARLLGITVVPEVDLPGHTESVVAAYPELGCLGQDDHPAPITHPRTAFGISEHHINLTDDALRLCRDALDAVMEIFPTSPIHIGGDECPGHEWFRHEPTRERLAGLGITGPHEAQAWFERQICDHVTGAGREVIAWDEVLEAGAPPEVTVMVWRDADDLARAAQLGHDVVAAPARHTYLDHGISAGPQAPVTIDAPLTMDDVAGLHDVLAAVDSPHLLGGQFQLWTEYLRTPAQVEDAAFPRGTSIAEQLWTNEPARPIAELEAQTRRLTAMAVNWHR
ncbi:MAG: beta-N-acetylhexosaminidase [Cutibacterium granulosum]|uniref:beta-N-acetylhexosaminidase n=1 Tax=Cutibacterium granulosum TaxID=33011 RepID=UPI002B22B2D2|nr:beta-N-acetylhexosaminidase [Cutibacterium granulosum]MEA5648805.1 beta-N-acetylhexosaminidase [Cutibacterium granulosum]MEA5653706.1 beta-N-acetylhexosaminidase [Cutibacterium granulosum]MEA5663415.1 beta-N-acetylhexosaminidase [Cutibacterium granulosum]MEA5664402.1 beta-N-acetylhexosaminidase [Cutibacterium granulosum]